MARHRYAWSILAIVASLAAGGGLLSAQRIMSGFYGRIPPRLATPESYDGTFNFCRVLFSSDRREKQGWSTDYPGADLNFSVRLAEVTKVRVKMRHDGGELVPDAVVVRLTDDALFTCPFALVEDAGTAHFSDAEVERLRAYLLKGGFLFVSDYHGTWAREQFDAQVRRALPAGEFPTVDLTPPGHPIWRTLFQVTALPQMASIQTWRRTGGSTIERWNDDGSSPTARGIADRSGRLMVVMVHNSDIPDGWEREGEDPQYFFQFSPGAYAVGLDVLLYSMVH